MLNLIFIIIVKQIMLLFSTNLFGQQSGVATLGLDGKLASNQIPESLLGSVHYMGTWNAETNEPQICSSIHIK